MIGDDWFFEYDDRAAARAEDFALERALEERRERRENEKSKN